MLIVIFIAFCCQIWFISYFYPKQVVRRIDYVLTNYPKNTHPKLYPVTPERIVSIKQIYLWLNYFFITIGILLLVNFSFIETDYASNLHFLDDLPLLYGMSQYIPYIFIELFCFKQLKRMKLLHLSSTRSAQLQPRKLLDYVPKHYLLLASLVYVVFVAFELLINQSGITSEVVIKLTTVTFVNILFIGIALMNIYGEKRNPLQNDDERAKQTKFTLLSLVFISIFMTLYLMAHTWVNLYGYNYAEILINCLYFQFIALYSLGALLGRFKIEEMNFDAYKIEA